MMLVLLLLCSGFFQCTLSNRLRVFHYNGDLEANRRNALNYCKGKNMSLVTLYDENDANFTQTFQGDDLFWLGLHKHHLNISSWSNNETVIFNLSNVTQSDYQSCEAIMNDSWTNMNCSQPLAFMCYKGNSSYKNYTLIENPKNWCQATQFCRKHYTDLVSISSTEQNNDVIKKGENKTFWIGLIHDQWKWEDNGCSTYRNWVYPSHHGTLTSQALGSLTMNKIEDNDDIENRPICSKGKVRIIPIHQNLIWEQAFDYCNSNHTGLLWIQDQEDQQAVQQRLKRQPLSGDHFWIGLRQSRVFGFWIWMSDRIVSYSNWENNTQPKQPLSHQCGAISRLDFTWSDKNCQLQLPFLCEEEIHFMNP